MMVVETVTTVVFKRLRSTKIVQEEAPTGRDHARMISIAVHDVQECVLTRIYNPKQQRKAEERWVVPCECPVKRAVKSGSSCEGSACSHQTISTQP